MTEEKTMGFEMKPTKNKPKRKYKKGSKYDPIIEAFMNGDSKLSEVSVEGKTHSYLATQLKKRIEANNLTKKVEVSTASNKCFLEKLTPETPAKKTAKK
jgi:hypothetical protein